MKTKKIKNRRQKSAKYFEMTGTSKYGQKIAKQKRGNFSDNSPFELKESGNGVDLKEFNRIRFKGKF
jgi:hypothetical protein